MAEEKKLYSNYDMNTWFRTCEEEVLEPLEGKVTGTIPSWIRGTLLRNGPGCKKIGDSEYQHVFDGLALIHRFLLKDGRATYQCRFLRSNAYEKNTAANRIVVTEFGTGAVPDPCRTIFDRISSIFNFGNVQTDNAVISMYPFGDQIYAMTEVPTLYKVDPESLQTLGNQHLPVSLVVSHTAHPHVMPNGDIYNVGLSVAKGYVSYVVVKFTNNENGNMFETTEIVGSVRPRWQLNPGYMHSFGITENYFVIIDQPLCISLVNMMRRFIFSRPIYSALVTYPEYEVDGKVMIDICSYKDAKIIDAMFLEAIKSMQSNPDYGQWCQSRPKRIEVPLDAPPLSKVETKLIADVGVETPTINYKFYNGRPYKYFYGVGSDITEHAGSIVKIDVQTRKFITWYRPNCYPSEPIFIAHPDAKKEDDGVLLSAVLWGNDNRAITLLVLAANDLEEIARVDFVTPSEVPRCFHGWYLPDKMSVK